MTERGKGVLMFDTKEPHISGYLIIGNTHYEIVGQKINQIRTHLEVRKTGEVQQQQRDLFDDGSAASGERKCDLV
jgi:hypothetical protein